jgi:hypothetical protein
VKVTCLITAALAVSLVTQSWAEAPGMKMTTPIPEGIETPDILETSIGTLTSVDGVPDAETTQKVYDNLDLNRATEAFLNCIPIASMYALKHGLLKGCDSRLMSAFRCDQITVIGYLLRSSPCQPTSYLSLETA